MEKLDLLVIWTTTLLLLFSSHVQTENEVPKWAKRVKKGNEQVVTYRLEFYFYDYISGRNPSAVKVGESSITKSSNTSFGKLFIADDRLTVGPDPNSKLIGRARGIYGLAGKSDADIIYVMSLVFLDGIYNGSSLSIMSIDHFQSTVREMSVLGGTGLFRLARGYAILRTYSETDHSAVVGYNVTVSVPVI